MHPDTLYFEKFQRNGTVFLRAIIFTVDDDFNPETKSVRDIMEIDFGEKEVKKLIREIVKQYDFWNTLEFSKQHKDVPLGRTKKFESQALRIIASLETEIR